ncbi:hypothetical protein ACTFIV_005198 [Dictyostelium citrinum]
MLSHATVTVTPGELEDEQFDDEMCDFILVMQEDLDVQDGINKKWDNVRARSCTVFTPKSLEAAQMLLARRYNLPKETHLIACPDEDRSTASEGLQFWSRTTFFPAMVSS